MKNIDHFMNFPIKDVFFCCISQRNFALSLLWRHCTIALKKFYGCCWKYIFVMISMKEMFSISTLRFSKNKSRKTKNKNKRKITSSWTWFSKRLLSFVFKWKIFVFTYNVSGDEINCFDDNDDEVNFIYELSIFNKLHDKHKLSENNRSKLVTGFYIEGYDIWFVL